MMGALDHDASSVINDNTVEGGLVRRPLRRPLFAIQDSDGKKAFLAAHPELQDYFLQERRRRYESFLNNVARYLGQVPELAEAYLNDQTKFIKEMLDKFGQRPLVSSKVISVSYRGERQTSGSPQRQRTA